MPDPSTGLRAGGRPWPRVSIVTPSYNQAQFIEETIRSVLLQGYPNLEYIIIDGGSTDKSVEIIKKFEPWLAYWVSKKDSGQAQAINKGFRKATGDIFAWVNSDDMLLPQAVYLAAVYLMEHPEVGVVTGDRIVVNEQGKKAGSRSWKKFVPWQFRYCCGIAQEATFWRRDLFYRVGELDESLHFAMDFDLWIRFVKAASFHHLPALLGAYRSHNTAKSHFVRSAQYGLQLPNQQTLRYIEETVKVRKRHYGRDPLSIEKFFLRWLHGFLRKVDEISGRYADRQRYVANKLYALKIYSDQHKHIDSVNG